MHSSSESPGGSPAAPPAARPPAAPTIGQLPVPRPPPTEPIAVPTVAPARQPTQPVTPPTDPRVLLGMQMKAVLTRFADWSRDHASAPCPDSATLGLVAIDPWGHPIELTCTDQPADQVIGATSAGPDGIAGNDDDVTSWALGREVTHLVRGARWTSTQAPAVRRSNERSSARDHEPAMTPATPAISPASPTRTKPRALPSDAGTDDIPARR